MALEKVSRLYEVIWMDPCETKFNINELEELLSHEGVDSTELLVTTSCFGNIVYEDDTSVILEHSLDGKGLAKITTIHKALIQEIIPYSRNDKVNLKDYWRDQRTTKRRRLVEVDWRTSDEKRVEVRELEKLQEGILEKLLMPKLSYGVVAMEDCDALILKHYENSLDIRRVEIIPQSLIKRVTPFYSKRK